MSDWMTALRTVQPGGSARQALSSARTNAVSEGLLELERRLRYLEGGGRRRGSSNRRPRFQVMFEPVTQRLYVSEGALIGRSGWVRPVVPEIGGVALTADPAPYIDCTGKSAAKTWLVVVAIFPGVAKVELVDKDEVDPAATAGAREVWVLAEIEFEATATGLALLGFVPLWASDIPDGVDGSWAGAPDPFQIVVRDAGGLKIRVLPGQVQVMELRGSGASIRPVIRPHTALVELPEQDLTATSGVWVLAEFYEALRTTGVLPRQRGSQNFQSYGIVVSTTHTTPAAYEAISASFGELYFWVGRVVVTGGVASIEQHLRSDLVVPMYGYGYEVLGAVAGQILDVDGDGLLIVDPKTVAAKVRSTDANTLVVGTDDLLKVAPVVVVSADVPNEITASPTDGGAVYNP